MVHACAQLYAVKCLGARLMGVAKFNRFLGVGLIGVVRIWSRVKFKFWSRSRVKAENWGSKFLIPVTGGSIELLSISIRFESSGSRFWLQPWLLTHL